jgi:hypothetical protein
MKCCEDLTILIGYRIYMTLLVNLYHNFDINQPVKPVVSDLSFPYFIDLDGWQWMTSDSWPLLPQGRDRTVSWATSSDVQRPKKRKWDDHGCMHLWDPMGPWSGNDHRLWTRITYSFFFWANWDSQLLDIWYNIYIHIHIAYHTLYRLSLNGVVWK